MPTPTDPTATAATLDVAWDYPGCGDNALSWPRAMPIPHVGDLIYNEAEELFRVQRVAYRPSRLSVYIVCERWTNV